MDSYPEFRVLDLHHRLFVPVGDLLQLLPMWRLAVSVLDRIRSQPPEVGRRHWGNCVFCICLRPNLTFESLPHASHVVGIRIYQSQQWLILSIVFRFSEHHCHTSNFRCQRNHMISKHSSVIPPMIQILFTILIFCQ